MTGRTHDLAALTALSMSLIIFPIEKISLSTAIVAVVANMIGGIAPDIDQPTAPLWRNLPVGGIIGRTLTRLLGGHRFLSHSVIGAFIFGFGIKFVLEKLSPSFPQLNMEIIWLAFMIGFVSHLMMDTFTREGVPWLLPVPVKFGLPPFKVFRLTTGGVMEKFIVFPGLMIFNIYFFFANYSRFWEIIKQQIK